MHKFKYEHSFPNMMSDELKLIDLNPSLEKGSLVYIVRSGAHEDSSKLRDLIIFENFERDNRLAIGDIYTNSGIKLLPETKFSGRLIQAFKMYERARFEASAEAFYIGNESILLQFEKEGFNVYSELVKNIQL